MRSEMWREGWARHAAGGRARRGARRAKARPCGGHMGASICVRFRCMLDFMPSRGASLFMRDRRADLLMCDRRADFFMRERRAVDQQRLKEILQRTAATEDARFYRAGAALQDFGDFFVAQAFEVAEDHRAAEHLGNFLECALHRGLNFVGGKLLEGRSGEVFDLDGRMTFFGFGVDGDVFLKMAFEPALVVQVFADGDAVEPSLKRTAPTETANAAKRLQEDFLGAIGGVCDIS